MPVPDFSPGEVLTAAAMDSIGLWLVKTQTIGAGVGSVTVSDVFSADYDAYKITITGGVGSTATIMRLQLGATTSGYYAAYNRVVYSSGAASPASDNNAANFARCGFATTDTLNGNFELLQPFATKRTIFQGAFVPAGTGDIAGTGSGFLNNATSYTAFTIIAATGTITGGTIRVYGYRN
jgi:hypothetical protein